MTMFTRVNHVLRQYPATSIYIACVATTLAVVSTQIMLTTGVILLVIAIIGFILIPMQRETASVRRTGQESIVSDVGDQKPEPRHLTRAQVLALFLFVVTAFTIVSVRTELQQRQINDNANRIEVIQFNQCKIRNDSAQRQIALIDSAIEAEKRKTPPDAKRIHDLEDFKPPILDCGTRP